MLDKSIQREVTARQGVEGRPVWDFEGERGCGEISITVALSTGRGMHIAIFLRSNFIGSHSLMNFARLCELRGLCTSRAAAIHGVETRRSASLLEEPCVTER